MIVHFDYSSPVAVADFDYCGKVIRIIRSLNRTVADAIGRDLFIELATNMPDEEDVGLLYKKTLATLDRSDLAIFDVRRKGVVGPDYQAVYTLQANKPTLLPVHEGEDAGPFVGGLNYALLQRKSTINGNLGAACNFLRGVNIE